jgi:hypothetical protein
MSPASEPSSDGEGGLGIFAGGCGAGGRGTIMALSRAGGARRGRLESVCVVARRREVQRQ